MSNRSSLHVVLFSVLSYLVYIYKINEVNSVRLTVCQATILKQRNKLHMGNVLFCMIPEHPS